MNNCVEKSEYNNIYTTNTGGFSAIVKENEVWIFYANRISTGEFMIVMASMYVGVISGNIMANVGALTVQMNNQGSVQFLYGGETNGVYVRAVKLF